jgi:hypothetical protein
MGCPAKNNGVNSVEEDIVTVYVLEINPHEY